MNKCVFKTCACGISDTKSDTKFKYCLSFILRPHSCSSYFNYFTYRFSCHPAHSAWQTGFVKPDKPHLTLRHSRRALASPAQLRDDYLPAPPWKHRQYLLTLQVSRYRLLVFPGSAHTFDSHYAPFPTIGSQLCEINSPGYGWNEHVMVPLSACVQSTCRVLGYERVYLPLCKVADTPFHIQGDAVCCHAEVNKQLLLSAFKLQCWCSDSLKYLSPSRSNIFRD